MKAVEPMKSNCPPWLQAIAAFVLRCCLASCAHHSSAIPSAEYSTKIVGHWQGTVGDVKETMAIAADGSFACEIHPLGFLANTLSQKRPGKISGTWNITGPIMTLSITGEKNENIENLTASSTIVAFAPDKLVLKSDHGETSTFQRVLTF